MKKKNKKLEEEGRISLWPEATPYRNGKALVANRPWTPG